MRGHRARSGSEDRGGDSLNVRCRSAEYAGDAGVEQIDLSARAGSIPGCIRDASEPRGLDRHQAVVGDDERFEFAELHALPGRRQLRKSEPRVVPLVLGADPCASRKYRCPERSGAGLGDDDGAGLSLAADLVEEVVALVVDDDERREVDDVDLPHRLHAELGVLEHVDVLDVVEGQPCGGTADRSEVEARRPPQQARTAILTPDDDEEETTETRRKKKYYN